jgi:queuine/archaeosine tRNA-ribosyltransferase
MSYTNFIGGVSPFKQKVYDKEFYFKKDGKKITNQEYCRLQASIGPDVPPSFNLQTNHPDPCGKKEKREYERALNQRKREIKQDDQKRPKK